uniref:Uncharacterized protein n=1 Tax=Sinocyclocheilus grahami TaxID=75366 RepID=A0A672L0A9_SINGR
MIFFVDIEFPSKKSTVVVPWYFYIRKGTERLPYSYTVVFYSMATPEYHVINVLNAAQTVFSEINKHLWICPTHFVNQMMFCLNILLCLNLSGLVKLWSALTLLGSYQNEACAFRVTQVHFPQC